jgi:hypothetical protein
MDISVHFDARQYKTVMQFTYVLDNKVHCREIDSVENTPYPSARLDSEQIQLLISFLHQALVASVMREPDYESQRGISVPVDTNPTRE